VRLYVFDDHRLGVGTADGRLNDITELLDGAVAPRERMSALIARWAGLRDAVAQAAAADGEHALEDVTLRAPQPSPAAKIVAAPVNYVLHQREMGGTDGVYKDAAVKSIETYAGFVKATSSVTGPDGSIDLPYSDRRVDHEAEVGVIIGRRASRVRREDAHDHVFGYVPLLDITIRGEEDRSFRKSFDTFTPIGPAIVTADDVPDPDDISFQLTVNGEIRQRANTRDLIYGVTRLIELYSGAMTLEPGDIIATGTPEGVGPIVSGDLVVLSIDGIGTLRMPVRARWGET
jgi:2-keto-4-pentenoate hydratase/2-oxohepta-3-ene-1,7-dioic acid hydratase in catechol pathway